MLIESSVDGSTRVNKPERNRAIYEAAVLARKRASMMAKVASAQAERSLEGADRAEALINRIRNPSA
jgi:hypothetical protein